MQFVCPLAGVWHSVHLKLRERWEGEGRIGNEPPIPLILAGWNFSSDLEKKLRWEETVLWAAERGCSELIPALKPNEEYRTDEISETYPGQHYRMDRYEERPKVAPESVERALADLSSNWHDIAGLELAAATKPVGFTGAKSRRLLVNVTGSYTPPWGTWAALAPGEARKHFSDFRSRINARIAPLAVDHIDFEIVPLE